MILYFTQQIVEGLLQNFDGWALWFHHLEALVWLNCIYPSSYLCVDSFCVTLYSRECEFCGDYQTILVWSHQPNPKPLPNNLLYNSWYSWPCHILYSTFFLPSTIYLNNLWTRPDPRRPRFYYLSSPTSYQRY